MNFLLNLLKMIVPRFIRQLKQKKFNNLPYEIKLIIFEKLNTIPGSNPIHHVLFLFFSLEYKLF